MSDEATRELWRRAGAGDLSAAIDYVIALMRGTAPLDPFSFKEAWVWGCSHVEGRVPLTGACVRFLRPRTAEELRSMPVLSGREVFADRRNPHEDLRDTLARWLVAHQGKIIALRQDPPAFEAIEPPEEVRRLRRTLSLAANYLPAELIDPDRALRMLNIPRASNTP